MAALFDDINHYITVVTDIIQLFEPTMYLSSPPSNIYRRHCIGAYFLRERRTVAKIPNENCKFPNNKESKILSSTYLGFLSQSVNSQSVSQSVNCQSMTSHCLEIASS